MKSKLALKLLLLAPAIILASCGSKKSSSSQTSTSQSGKTVYTVSESEWKKELTMSNDQNYIYTVSATIDGQSMTASCQYDKGKIKIDSGEEFPEYIEILFDTYNQATDEISYNSYYYSNGWKARKVSNYLGQLSEFTMRLPFAYDEFTYDSENKVYRAESCTLFLLTFTNLEYKFENGVLVSTKIELMPVYRDGAASNVYTYRTTYHSHGSASVTLPKVDPEPEPSKTREDFANWVKNIDYKQYPYSTAEVHVEMNNDGTITELNYSAIWDTETLSWVDPKGEQSEPVPTAISLIESYELMEKNGYTIEDHYSDDLHTVDAHIQVGDMGGETIHAVFNEYAFPIYIEIEVDISYEDFATHVYQEMTVEYK